MAIHLDDNINDIDGTPSSALKTNAVPIQLKRSAKRTMERRKESRVSNGVDSGCGVGNGVDRGRVDVVVDGAHKIPARDVLAFQVLLLLL